MPILLGMYDQPKDIGMIGENVVALWASQAGFAPTKFTWDKFGSDYIIQARPAAGERRRLLVDPPPMSCVVQVKTTRKHEGHVDVTLSNLHALATMTMPAFVIVVVLDEFEQPCDARAIHIDRGWVDKIIRRIVELPMEERSDLHKKTMRCNWSEDGTVLEGPHYWMSLLTFIEHTAGVDARKYAADKAQWNDEAGYDAHRWRLTVTLPKMRGDEASDTLARFAVGLIDSLPLANMRIIQLRFGLEELVRDGSRAEGIHIQFSGSPPSDNVEISVRSNDGQEEAVLPATLRTARSVFGFLPDEHDIWRFTSDHLDIVVRSPRGEEDPRVTLRLSLDDGGPLPDLARAVRAFRILSAGEGCDFLVRIADDAEPVLLRVAPKAVPEIVRGSHYRQAIEDADRVVRLFGAENVVITDGEALDRESRRLRLMVMFQGPMDSEIEMRTRVINDPDDGEQWNPNEVEQLAIVNFTWAHVEGRTFCQAYALRGRPTFEMQGDDVWVSLKSHVVELLGRRVFRTEDPRREMFAFAHAEAERLRKRGGLVLAPGGDEVE